jgi:hypothetical protein
MIKGYVGAILVLMSFAGISYLVRVNVDKFMDFDTVMYYWFCFCILTGFWELVYLSCYKHISHYARYLIKHNKSVWTERYKINMIFPWNTARLFYAEYAAHADREYMSLSDDWSRLIEGSHALLCAVFASMSLVYQYQENTFSALICAGIAMGFQFMNSLLYLGEYNIQCNDPESINYSYTKNFPLGFLGLDRPFMWINLYWLLFPGYIISYILNDVYMSLSS